MTARNRNLLILIVLIVLAILAFSRVRWPVAYDWDGTFRPAVLSFLNGKGIEKVDPSSTLYNPPWVVGPLTPIAVLPYEIGRGLLLIVTIASFWFAAIRLKARPIPTIAFLLSPLVLAGVVFGNVEWLPILGVAVEGPIGVLLLAIKPQMGLGLALFLLVEAWRTKGSSALLRLVLPLAVVSILFALYFGFGLRPCSPISDARMSR